MFTAKDEPNTLDHAPVIAQLPSLNGHSQKQLAANGLLTEALPGTPEGFEDELADSSEPNGAQPEHHPIISNIPHGEPSSMFETLKKQPTSTPGHTGPSAAAPAGELPFPPDPVVPFLESAAQSPVQEASSFVRTESSGENGSRHVSEATGALSPSAGGGAKASVLEAVRVADGGKKKVSWPDLHGSSLIAVREFEASDSELSDSDDDDDSESSQSCACVIQ